jgi:hypothetical protein
MLANLGLVIKNINNRHVKVVHLRCHAKISQSMGLLIVFLLWLGKSLMNKFALTYDFIIFRLALQELLSLEYFHR